MKVPPAQIERFVSDPDPAVVAVLVYGPDAGLVRERCGRLVRSILEDPNDPFAIAEFSAVALKDDPSRLSDEAATLALGGVRRVIRLRDAGDREADAVQAAIGLDNGGALVIVDAGDLSPRSTLRKVFESDPRAAAIPCYADDDRVLQSLIDETLRSRNIRISRDALFFLVENLGSDRQISRNEIEKLALFVGDGGQVELEDAVACVGDSASVSIDDVVFAAGGGDAAALLRSLARALAEGVEPIAILRAAQRHFQRLGLCAAQIEAGASADQVVSSLRPPVFFKKKAAFRTQLGKWRRDAIDLALDALTDAEVRCKSTGVPAAPTCERALLQIAARAGRARRS